MLRPLNSAAGFPRLSPGEVHVWCVPLVSATGRIEAQGSVLCESRPWYSVNLSEDERDRAARFSLERDRIRYAAARGTLRWLLGGYLGIDPADIRFCYGTFGKPILAGRFAERLRFNLSHAGGWAAYAVSRDRNVGIDIEPLRNDVPWQELAPMVFSANERAEFGKIPSCEKAAAFLRGWTKKEAYAKGRGEGLSLRLDTFEVPLGTLEGRISVGVRSVRGQPSGWRLYPLELLHGFASALAVEGTPARIILHHRTGRTAATKPATAVRFHGPEPSAEFPGTSGSVRGNAGSGGKNPRNRSEGAWRT